MQYSGLHFPSLRWGAAALVALALTGCPGGEPRHVVRGTLLSASQPLVVADRELGLGMVELTFYAVDDAGQLATEPAAQTLADEDGSFVVQGQDGRGLPPGKYRVAIRQWDPYPHTDKLAGRFARDRTPIEFDVGGPEPLTIELTTDWMHR